MCTLLYFVVRAHRLPSRHAIKNVRTPSHPPRNRGVHDTVYNMCSVYKYIYIYLRGTPPVKTPKKESVEEKKKKYAVPRAAHRQ